MSKLKKALEKAHAERREDQETSSSYALVPIKKHAITRSTITASLTAQTLHQNRILGYVDRPEIKDHYNLLRTQIFQKTRHKQHAALMVVGCSGNEGATLTAINLSISIANQFDLSAIVVDAQLRVPKMHTYFGINEAHKGLSDYLSGESLLHETIFDPGMERLRALFSGPPRSNSTEMLESRRMKELVMDMKESSPDCYTIVNAPPVLCSPDALVLSSYMDAVLLVAQSGKTTQTQIRRACKRLEGQNVIGLVLNDLSQ